jgi:hypothetical protein
MFEDEILVDCCASFRFCELLLIVTQLSSRFYRRISDDAEQKRNPSHSISHSNLPRNWGETLVPFGKVPKGFQKMCRASCNAAPACLKFGSEVGTGFSANAIQFFSGGRFVDPLKALCEAFFKLEFKGDGPPSFEIARSG